MSWVNNKAYGSVVLALLAVPVYWKHVANHCVHPLLSQTLRNRGAGTIQCQTTLLPSDGVALFGPLSTDWKVDRFTGSSLVVVKQVSVCLHLGVVWIFEICTPAVYHRSLL